MRKYSLCELQKHLIDFSKETGKTHISKKDIENEKNIPSIATYQRYFGSWKKALDSVGLKTGLITGRPTDPLIQVSPAALDIINGELLGDGSLILTGSNKSNACFSHSTANLLYGEFLYDKLFYAGVPLLKKEICKGRNGNKAQFRTRTKANIFWTNLYNKWYKNRTKILPSDIKLNNEVCLHWYLGDGYFENKTSKISTCNFSYKEVKALCNELTSIGFKASPNKRSGGYHIIRFSKYSFRQFLKWVGSCPVRGYEHRWGM